MDNEDQSTEVPAPYQTINVQSAAKVEEEMNIEKRYVLEEDENQKLSIRVIVGTRVKSGTCVEVSDRGGFIPIFRWDRMDSTPQEARSSYINSLITEKQDLEKQVEVCYRKLQRAFLFELPEAPR